MQMLKIHNSYSQNDLEHIDKLLRDYVEAEVEVGLYGPSLSNVGQVYKQREDKGRYIAAFLDLQLGSALLACDFFCADGVHCSICGRSSRQKRSPFESMSVSEFGDTFRWYNRLNSFTLRYRSQWDKIMGCLVLMYHSQSYASFIKAKSRKKKYRKIAENDFPSDAIDIVNIIEHQISRFDEAFRTPEAHGSGSIRKWVFSSQPAFDCKQIDLIVYWDLLQHTLDKIAAYMKIHSNKR